ncbi:hypothetical protein ACOQFV_26515 [Nocardiopsis changdeensis]|uniref:Secreted protein n=1 Tax=Nocardiopsis changdeensis TaxID=2831969 RepID=A0ABX8BEB8_9ACTN|nr:MULTISPECIES: hypothetical protein [Nocardiopsis]QUX20596.1 hypothetical protein KGD84_19020 [Nocardiopsis changdeensis]QYX36527.1 hypothetical protein K1J57_28475 [Nocardiopsis sp. MT53]
MLKKIMPAAAVAAAVMSTGLVSAAPASAATAAANMTISTGSGTMQFIDDGDVFKICDTAPNDGSPVFGAVFYNSYWDTSGHKRVMTILDSSDSGCNKKGYNIGNSGVYTFVICPGEWPTSAYQNSRGCTHSREFNE